MELRKRAFSEVHYIIITQEPPDELLITQPTEFSNEIINIIKKCPKDISQFIDAFTYYELSYKYLFNNGYNVSVLYDYYSKEFVQDLSNEIRLQLYFLDAKSDLEETCKSLKYYHNHLRYYCIFNNEDNVDFELENTIEDHIDFYKYIYDINKDKIFTSLNIPLLDVNIYKKLSSNIENKYEYFLPTINNYFLINSIIGNSPLVDKEPSKEEFHKILALQSKKAMDKPNSFERQNLLVKQINIIDSIIGLALNEKLFKLSTKFQPVYAPLIIVAPFISPDLKVYKKIADSPLMELFVKSITTEQSENYVNLQKNDSHNKLYSDNKLIVEALSLSMRYRQDKMLYLDDISFLHSSFWFSPTIRLPLSGKSIYRELSFFRAELHSNISRPNNRRNIKKVIIKFGKLLKERIISKKLEEIIKLRDRQIIVISDLPIEWLEIDGIPLAFTHDVCRIPETSPRVGMALYSSHSLFQYTIPKDILQKTLIIFGSDQKEFEVWRLECIALSKKKNFTIVSCENIQAVIDAVEKHKPDLLIFDCHGGYNSEEKSTYLEIGDERLTHEVIQNNHISAPIVFLSACSTAPTYGIVNTVANAFFQTGAFSVTTTYLPVEINAASILYIRMLNKLGEASNQILHKNWLEFISHIIRTSYIQTTYQKVREKVKISKKDISSQNVDALVESMFFNTRRTLYTELSKNIRRLNQIDQAALDAIVPEYLFYSNLGRGDLLLFETWKDAHLINNDTTIED
ncbi:CHAT domain-containing protein [Spirosoma endbachense]|uniref:CHAT domain-containing protein n=1 Tax=Spirosoma endbachense TaxID=2666025 RepID=A0A6P1VSF7_9BACT|nr:CHAT domain-containing protein [Spirosoma endbachense]QHV95625.1 CHAT domain-containing protein [Spirosoma endbachense]